MSLSDFLPTLDALRARGKTNAGAALLSLEGIITRGQALADAMTARERGEADHIATPFSELLSLVDGIDTFIAPLFGDLDYSPDLFIALRAAQDGLLRLQTVRRLFADQQTLTAGQVGGTAPTTAGLVPYVLRQGDSVERLALRYLGDIERFIEILELNALAYPYLITDRDYRPAIYDPQFFDPAMYDTNPQPDRTGIPDGVRVTGETIWLPPDANVPAGEATFTELDVELYGRDLALTDGVLALNAHAEARTVEGRDNIVQAVEQRIGTGRGELLLHPGYGMERPLAVGVEGTRANTVVAGLELARTVMQDPRVVRIPNAQVLFADTVSRIALEAILIGPGQRSLALNEVVPNSIVTGGRSP